MSVTTASIHRNIDRMDKWKKHLMKFNAKCKSCIWGGGITRSQASWTALGNTLPADKGKWSFTSAQHWWGHTWSRGAGFGLPNTRDGWICWSKSCAVMWQIRNWSIHHTERAGTAQSREEKAQGQGMDLINVCKYLMGGRSGEEGARLLSVVSTDWTRGYEHKLNHFPIWNSTWTLFYIRVVNWNLNVLKHEFLSWGLAALSVLKKRTIFTSKNKLGDFLFWNNLSFPY